MSHPPSRGAPRFPRLLAPIKYSGRMISRGNCFPGSPPSRVLTRDPYVVHVIFRLHKYLSIGPFEMRDHKNLRNKIRKKYHPCRLSAAVDPAKRGAKRTRFGLAMPDFRTEHCQLSSRSAGLSWHPALRKPGVLGAIPHRIASFLEGRLPLIQLFIFLTYTNGINPTQPIPRDFRPLVYGGSKTTRVLIRQVRGWVPSLIGCLSDQGVPRWSESHHAAPHTPPPAPSHQNIPGRMIRRGNHLPPVLHPPGYPPGYPTAHILPLCCIYLT